MSGHRRVMPLATAERALCPEAQERLEALVEERGLKFTAKTLGITEHQIERLRYGGKASRELVDRVQGRFYAHDDPYWQTLIAAGALALCLIAGCGGGVTSAGELDVDDAATDVHAPDAAEAEVEAAPPPLDAGEPCDVSPGVPVHLCDASAECDLNDSGGYCARVPSGRSVCVAPDATLSCL